MGYAGSFPVRADESMEALGEFTRTPDEPHLFRRVFDCLEDGVVITAQSAELDSTSVVYCNPAFASLLGDVRGDKTQRPSDISHLFGSSPPNDPLWTSLKESHRANVAFAHDVVVSMENGCRKVLRLRSEPVCDESGQVAHRIATFRDITEQADMEDLLRRNERLACIGLLAAGIAHEINNPTGAALLAAETALAMMDSPDGATPVEACLRNVVTSMDRCGRIVRTLLRYSRSEPSEKQACSINDVAEQVLELARPYAERKNATLCLELDPDVPLAPMNPLEIELVLVNLVRNSVEAGNGDATILIRTGRTEGGVRVDVSDNGCGMNQDQLTHVFDPLYTTRRQLGGSGLGMGIAQGIVEGHEGRMEVRSKAGMGTTVTIELPITQS